MKALTKIQQAAIISPLPGRIQAGVRSPFLEGLKMTAPLAVFFRLSCRAGLIRLHSVMADLFGQPHGWQRLLAVLRTHSFPPPKVSKSLCGGLSTYRRITAMITQTVRANTAQNPTRTAVFSVYLHRQCIRMGIAGALACALKADFLPP